MSRMLKNTLLLAITSICLIQSSVNAQSPEFVDVGIELQQYPTGFLLGLRAEFGIADHHAIHFRLGYNTFDHKDFGVQDSEIGCGFGGSLGYSYYFKPGQIGFFIGGRADFWRNEVDWIDEIGNVRIEGVSRITVFQPTAQIGYVFILNDTFVLTPTLAGGAEINIKTSGAKIGEGPILLWGANLAIRLGNKDRTKK